ncbi:hypothetical protein [Streptomyces cacaoi]
MPSEQGAVPVPEQLHQHARRRTRPVRGKTMCGTFGLVVQRAEVVVVGVEEVAHFVVRLQRPWRDRGETPFVR